MILSNSETVGVVLFELGGELRGVQALYFGGRYAGSSSNDIVGALNAAKLGEASK